MVCLAGYLCEQKLTLILTLKRDDNRNSLILNLIMIVELMLDGVIMDDRTRDKLIERSHTWWQITYIVFEHILNHLCNTIPTFKYQYI